MLWKGDHGRAKAGRPAWTYIQQLCEDTGCSHEDLPEAMNDREKWRERVRDIHASGTTWWWWWWHRKKIKWFFLRKSNIFIISFFTSCVWFAFVEFSDYWFIHLYCDTIYLIKAINLSEHTKINVDKLSYTCNIVLGFCLLFLFFLYPKQIALPFLFYITCTASDLCFYFWPMLQYHKKKTALGY